MSEETVKAFEELAQIEKNLIFVELAIRTASENLKEHMKNVKILKDRKRELLKVVKVVRARKPKAEPKPRKTRADKGRPRKSTAPPSSEPQAKPSADSEPTTIDSAFMQPETE